jgi:hypothetical protein
MAGRVARAADYHSAIIVSLAWIPGMDPARCPEDVCATKTFRQLTRCAPAPAQLAGPARRKSYTWQSAEQRGLVRRGLSL